jgi:hypothetical protein
MAFDQDDAAVFFGRDQEIADGLALLKKVRRLSDSGTIVVLGGSGSGKSSLVRAGLVPRLKKDPDAWLVVDPFRPQDDPLRELAQVVSRAFAAHGRSVTPANLHAVLQGSDVEPDALRSRGSPHSSVTAALKELAALEGALPDESVPPDARQYLRLLRDSLQRTVDCPVPAGQGRSSNVLVDMLTDLRRQSGRDNATVAVIVDQFEELLGGRQDPSFATFLRLLRDAAQHEGRPVVVVLTMRSDFLESFQKHPELADLRWEGLSVGPMRTAEIAQVIERPAAVAGIELEPGLVQTLLDDTTHADALPLLAFTLRELTDAFGRDRLLTLNEYRDKLGGLQGAVARSAEAVIEAAGATREDEELLRQALLRMVRITEAGTYARVVTRWDELPPRVRPVIERFVTARLLVAGDGGGGRTIEVAHEALFRSWEKLREWLAASAEALRVAADVERVAADWEQKRRDPEYLWSGARVARARELLEADQLPVSATAQAFVETSHLAAEARRRRDIRRVQIAAAVFSILFVIASASGIYARQKQLAAVGNAREANWQTWQAEGQRFASLVSARRAKWQEWQALGQRFAAQHNERVAIEARGAETEQRRKAEASEEVAQERLEEAQRERLRVQLGTVVAQLVQLAGEIAAAGEQRTSFEAEETLLRQRADEVTRSLEQNLAQAASFRGDLKPIQEYKFGELLSSGKDRQSLAFHRINSVILYPGLDLGTISDTQLRVSYAGLLTPGQFEALLQLKAKGGPIFKSDWDAKPRLHNVEVSRFVGRIIFAQQALEIWDQLKSRMPKLTASSTPRAVQTAVLHFTMLPSRTVGESERRFGPLIDDGRWIGVGEAITGLRMTRDDANRAEEMAKAIEAELADGGQR